MVSEFQVFLNERLDKLGWSGPEFARQMQRADKANAVSGSAVNAWRRDEYLPKREHIPAIARTLAVSEQEIWRMVQPEVMGNPAAAELLAREIPSAMTPQEVRLLLHLLRANVQALLAWNREEEARDGAPVAPRTSQNSDAVALPGATRRARRG